MSIETEKSIIDDLTTLAKDIMPQVVERKQSVRPYSDQVIRWTVKDFLYDDKGVHIDSASGKNITKDDWGLYEYLIVESIEKTSTYQELLKKLSIQFLNFSDNYLSSFIFEITHKCFYEKLEENQIELIVKDFISELDDKPKPSFADSALVGIVIRSKTIKISDKVTLRQTLKSDLEVEQPVDEFHRYNFFPTPTAFLKVKLIGKYIHSVHSKVGPIINTLKLFKVGSVKSLSTKEYSDSILHDRGIGTTHPLGRNEDPLEISLIIKEDENRLRKFCSIMEDKLPWDFGIANHPLSVTEIAFSRYDAVLMKFDSFESHISDTIMGLESIFLGGEKQELSYRLKLRVAKVMSLFGYNSQETVKIIRDTYDIRSKYVHGGLLNFKDKTKLQEKHGELKGLLKTLLDFLRISIVVSLMMHVGKEEFVARIDNSFLEEKSVKSLEQAINPAKQALGLN